MQESADSEDDTGSHHQAERFGEWVTEYDRIYRQDSSRSTKSWHQTLKDQLAELREILKIDEICKQLPATIDRLILVPHRDLHRFPIQAFFSQKFTCTYLPSFQIGLALQTKEKSQSVAPLLSVDPQDEESPLPSTQLESDVIRQLVHEAKHVSSETATLRIVTQTLETKVYQTFHFTGHGAYNLRRPGNSAIELSDGMLTAKHISRLDLSNYYLVCLAACETGLTGQDSISTEYVGLPSAFLKAGATNVLSTLWLVDDSACAWMMIQFFQQLITGQTPGNALKAAQYWMRTITWAELADWLIQLSQLPQLSMGTVDLLKARAQNTLQKGHRVGLDQPTKYKHPSYWAAFTLTGRG